MQTEPLTHWHAALQVCGAAPLHCNEFGAQTPVHDPALQQ
jgi:hypothetical protein